MLIPKLKGCLQDCGLLCSIMWWHSDVDGTAFPHEKMPAVCPGDKLAQPVQWATLQRVLGGVSGSQASLELDGVSAERDSESVLTRWLGTALRLLRSSAVYSGLP